MRIVLLLALVLKVWTQEQEHFLDVRQIVKGTIEAMQRLPEAAIQQQGQVNETTTTKPDDLMSLFKLPADIMTNLAVNAGYMDEPKTSTYGPWIVARNKEDVEDESDSWEEVKKKTKRKKRPEDDGLVNLRDLLRPLSPVQQPTPSYIRQVQGETGMVKTQQDPLYRREVSGDGQVRFVPVYPATVPSPPQYQPIPTTQAPFMVAVPSNLPRRVQQSNQRFEAQTFPPAINPFQQHQALPPRIIAPLPSFRLVNPSPVPQQVQPAQVEVQPSQSLSTAIVEQLSRKPLMVQPVLKTKEEGELFTRRTANLKSGKLSKVQSEETSSEDSSVWHLEESDPVPAVAKAVVSKTALRVRTIDHDVESHSEERSTDHGMSRKKTHPEKKRILKIPMMDDEPTTLPPTAEKPTEKFEEILTEAMIAEQTPRRRAHASKTIKFGRKEIDEKEEKLSSELEQLSDRDSEQEEESSEEITTTTRMPRRRSRLWKKKTVRPKSAFTTTSTTTEEPPKTPEGEEEEGETEKPKKEKKKRRKDKMKKKSKKNKRRRLAATTTSAPLEVTAQHCANIRSFARQFGFYDLGRFARKHCEFIENYYVELTCDRVDEYIEECHRFRRN